MSEIRTDAYRNPLPDFVKEGPLVMVCKWRAPKENHDKMTEHIRTNMNFQRVDPTSMFYVRTRHWYRPLDDGTEEWWFMDEYENAEAFETMQKRFRESFMDNQDTGGHFDSWLSMLVPGTVITQDLYSEVDGGRVEFEPFAQRKEAISTKLDPWWEHSDK